MNRWPPCIAAHPLGTQGVCSTLDDGGSEVLAESVSVPILRRAVLLPNGHHALVFGRVACDMALLAQQHDVMREVRLHAHWEP